MACACDGDVGEAGVSVGDRFRDRLSLSIELVSVPGRWEVVADLHSGPFAPFRFVSRGYGHVGVLLVREFIDRGEDRIGTVRVDEVDEGLEVAAGGVVDRVVLYFAPGREEDEFGVVGATSFFEIASRQRQCGERVPTTGECYTVAFGQESHDFSYGADVGAAQHRIWVGDVADFSGDDLAAGQADGRVGEFEPAVGLGGEEGAEAEGTRQHEGGGVEVGHHVAGAAPAVDGLGRVADHDELGVGALGVEDLFQQGLVSWASSRKRKSASILGWVRAHIFR